MKVKTNTFLEAKKENVCSAAHIVLCKIIILNFGHFYKHSVTLVV